MRNKRIILIVIMILALIVIIFGIILINTSFTGFFIKEQNQSTIKIGWIGGLSGSTASVGIENYRGVKLAVDRINSNYGINGRQIELIAQDDQYNPKESLNAYNNLVAQNVKFIIIETYGGFMALSKNAEKDNIILIDSIDSTEEMSNIGKNSFAIGIYDESIGFTIADYLNKKNSKKIAIITDNDDPFPLLVEKSLKSKYLGQSESEYYNLKATDFRSILTKFSNNEYIILLGWEETGRIVKQARELGIKSKIIGSDTFATENFVKNTGNNYDDLIFTFWQGNDKNKIFNQLIENYNKKYKKEPDNVLYLSVGYDSAMFLIKSIEDCPDVNNIECVKINLLDTKDQEGASGNITMDKDHITRSIQESMFMYRNGKIVPLED